MQTQLLGWVEHYGYFGIFASTVLGIVGLPIPDEVLMTFSGFLIAHGRMNYWWTLLTAAGGSLIGMSISYWVGCAFGYALLSRLLNRLPAYVNKMQTAERWFQRYGRIALTFGYFVPGVRHFTAYFAGMSQWRFGTFLAYAVPGACVWSVSFITAGSVLGESWETLASLVHLYLLGAFAIVGLALGSWMLWRKYRVTAR